MTEDELKQRCEQAEDNWQAAKQGDPEDCTWGFFVQDHYCPV